MKRAILSSLILITIIISSINLISALEVISPYNEDNPLKISPGETKEVQLILISTEGGENVSLTASVSGTGASIMGDAIHPLEEGKEIPVRIEVSAPADATIGENYDIDLSFEEVKTEDGGIFSITSSVTKKIPVTIVDKSGETQNTRSGLTSLLILVVIVAAILIKIFLIGKERN